MKGGVKTIFKLSGIGILAILSCHAYASGYRLEFQSTSVLADSGDAAVVEDAGTNWYNSAGLVYLPRQVALSGISIYNSTVFRGTTVAPSFFGPPFSFQTTGSASSHINPFLPAVHYNIPLKDGLAVGLSIVPAWGLLSSYGEGSILRYNLVRIYTRTLDIAPSLAVKLNNQWSIGVGPDFHYFSVLSRSHVRTQGPALFGGTLNDSISRYSVQSWNYGAHFGILYRYDDRTRIGLNYRTQITQKMNGYSAFALDNIANFESNQFALRIPLPPTASLSAYHDMTPCWALMGTITYDGWSVLNRYHARYFIQPPTPTNPSGIIPDVILPQHMRDTVDISGGTHFRWNPQLMLRASIKYEQTPTRSQYRDVAFPDGAKLGLNFGARYQVTKELALDVIYAHVFCDKVTINDFNPVSLAHATGHSTTSIDLAGAQVVYNF